MRKFGIVQRCVDVMPSAWRHRIRWVMVSELLKLTPTPQQAEMLTTAVRACNAAANHAAGVAFEHRTANKFALQKVVYADLRDRFGLSAQMAVRAIAKACDAYKRDKSSEPDGWLGVD